MIGRRLVQESIRAKKITNGYPPEGLIVVRNTQIKSSWLVLNEFIRAPHCIGLDVYFITIRSDGYSEVCLLFVFDKGNRYRIKPRSKQRAMSFGERWSRRGIK